MLSRINSSTVSRLQRTINSAQLRSFTSTQVLDKYDVVVVGKYLVYLLSVDLKGRLLTLNPYSYTKPCTSNV
jgi:hypothetical protein